MPTHLEEIYGIRWISKKTRRLIGMSAHYDLAAARESIKEISHKNSGLRPEFNNESKVAVQILQAGSRSELYKDLAQHGSLYATTRKNDRNAAFFGKLRAVYERMGGVNNIPTATIRVPQKKTAAKKAAPSTARAKMPADRLQTRSGRRHPDAPAP